MKTCLFLAASCLFAQDTSTPVTLFDLGERVTASGRWAQLWDNGPAFDQSEQGKSYPMSLYVARAFYLGQTSMRSVLTIRVTGDATIATNTPNCSGIDSQTIKCDWIDLCPDEVTQMANNNVFDCAANDIYPNRFDWVMSISPTAQGTIRQTMSLVNYLYGTYAFADDDSGFFARSWIAPRPQVVPPADEPGGSTNGPPAIPTGNKTPNDTGGVGGSGNGIPGIRLATRHILRQPQQVCRKCMKY